MRELFSLTGYEYKKICKRKSTWIAMGIVLALTLFSGYGTILGDYFIDGEKIGSHYDIMKKETAYLKEMEGQKLDEAFFQQAQETFAQADELWGDAEEDLAISDHGYEYEDIINRGKEYYLNYYLPYEQMIGICADMKLDITQTDETSFYGAREELLKTTYEGEGLSQGEIEAHMKENEKIKVPFSYGNMRGFARYFALQYTTGISLAFAVAICIAPLFAGEYTAKVDQLLLSARYGKNKVIQAKLLTGFSFAGSSALVMFGISILEIGMIYGLSGWRLPVQICGNGFYLSLPVNMLQMLGISAGCGIMAVLMVAGVVMFCSAKMKSPFGVIIIAFLFIFIPMAVINIVVEHRFLYMLFNAMPVNMMHSWAAVADQMFHIGNGYYYFYQVVPVVYLCAMLLLSAWAYCSFKKHQIG